MKYLVNGEKNIHLNYSKIIIIEIKIDLKNKMYK
jgi:hypothetical protein